MALGFSRDDELQAKGLHQRCVRPKVVKVDPGRGFGVDWKFVAFRSDTSAGFSIQPEPG